MKNLICFLSFLFLIVSVSCVADHKPNKTITIKASDIVTKNIIVKGMTCVGCEVTLEENLSNIEGVVNVKASHTKSNALIDFDSTKTTIKKIKLAIKKAGYKAY